VNLVFGGKPRGRGELSRKNIGKRGMIPRSEILWDQLFERAPGKTPKARGNEPWGHKVGGTTNSKGEIVKKKKNEHLTLGGGEIQSYKEWRHQNPSILNREKRGSKFLEKMGILNDPEGSLLTSTEKEKSIKKPVRRVFREYFEKKRNHKKEDLKKCFNQKPGRAFEGVLPQGRKTSGKGRCPPRNE